jgi:serine/threonine protein kinase
VETASTSGGCRSSGDSLNKPGAAAVDQQLSARQQRLAARQQRYALLRKIISPKLDIWGLGTVLYFLLADRDIFIHENGWELENLADVTSASYGVQLPPDIAASAGARDFLQRCLERNPDMRATAKELLLHPWLRGSPLPEAEEVPEQQQQQPERKHHSKSSIDLPWMPQPGSPPLIAIRAFSPSTPESPSTSE